MFEILLAAVEGKIQVAAAALGVPIGIGLRVRTHAPLDSLRTRRL